MSGSTAGTPGGGGGAGWPRTLSIDPDATQYGGGGSAIGADFEDAAVGEDAAADAESFRELGQPESCFIVAFDPGDSYSGRARRSLRNVTNRSRRTSVTGRSFSSDVAEESPGFTEHRFLEHGVEFGVEFFIGRGELYLAELEPLAGEVFNEAFAAFGSLSMRSTWAWRTCDI